MFKLKRALRLSQALSPPVVGSDQSLLLQIRDAALNFTDLRYNHGSDAMREENVRSIGRESDKNSLVLHFTMGHHPEPRNSSKIVLTTETHKASLSKGRIELKSLVGKEKLSVSDKKMWTTYSFPGKSYTVADITCMALKLDFLVYGSRARSIFYFSLQEESPLPVTEYCHADCGIMRLWLNPCGSRLVFEDERHSIYLFNPLNDQVLPVMGFKGVLEAVLWDVNDNQIFILAESNQNFVYLYSHTNIWCPKVTFLGAFARPSGFQPVGLHNGILHCKVDWLALSVFFILLVLTPNGIQ
ncbi:hypothetical protein L7F22_032985 [Adiantum nelumboides]|nr:hypothetical protein [Adiantum nelumboides]